MNRREKDAHLDLCRRLATALAERDAARAEVAEARCACYPGPCDFEEGQRDIRERVEAVCAASTSPDEIGDWWVRVSDVNAALDGNP